MENRIWNELFDANTFVQTNSYMVSPSASAEDAVGDGVVTGYGSIEGRAVFAAVQDETVLKGSVGIAHASKIASCIEMAVKCGAPFLMVINSAGARINEGIEVLSGYGAIAKAVSEALGIIPVFAMVNGQCSGFAAVLAEMADFVLMSQEGSYLAISGKEALAAASGKDCKEAGTAKANLHAGNISYFGENSGDCFCKIKELLSYLPDSCDREPPAAESEDPYTRPVQAQKFGTFEPYDVKDLIREIADHGTWCELSAGYAPNAVTGLARIGDRTACIIANQPAEADGDLDTAACNKIAGMLAFCDRFSIPVVTLTNTNGFAVSLEEEQNGLTSAAALLITSYTNSSVPKINVITGKAYGSAYIAMNGKQTGADLVYAWKQADIAMITPEAGALLIYNDQIQAAEDPAAARKAYIQKYRAEYASPVYAAAKGLVDDMIDPAETRARIISALYLLQS